jgi:hypothetical protein
VFNDKGMPHQFPFAGRFCIAGRLITVLCAPVRFTFALRLATLLNLYSGVYEISGIDKAPSEIAFRKIAKLISQTVVGRPSYGQVVSVWDFMKWVTTFENKKNSKVSCALPFVEVRTFAL